MKIYEKYGKVPEPHEKSQLELAQFSIARDLESNGWLYFLYRMSLTSDDSVRLYSLMMSQAGDLVLGINFSETAKLDVEPLKDVLKLACLQVIYGHLASRATALRNKYGDRVFELAAEMVVAQVYPFNGLKAAGFIMAHPSLYGFPEEQTVETYCELLYKHILDKYGIAQACPPPVGHVSDARQGQQAQEQENDQCPKCGKPMPQQGDQGQPGDQCQKEDSEDSSATNQGQKEDSEDSSATQQDSQCCSGATTKPGDAQQGAPSSGQAGSSRVQKGKNTSGNKSMQGQSGAGSNGALNTSTGTCSHCGQSHLKGNEGQSENTGPVKPEKSTNGSQSPIDQDKLRDQINKDAPKSLQSSLHDKNKLNKQPDWIKDGQIDQQKLKEAVARGEVMPGGIGDISQFASDALADSTSKEIINGAFNRTDIKNQGWIKGNAMEFIKSLNREPVIEWITFVRNSERRHTDLDRQPTRLRLSRRHKAYFGRTHTSMCFGLVCIDTSGSMGPHELSVIDAELKAMLRRGVYLEVMMVDAAVQQKPEKYTKHTTLGNFFGGGGTDFRPAFDYVGKMDEKPDIMVYFTDGYGTAPDQEPQWISLGHTDLIWVLTDKGMSATEFTERVCKYGQPVIFDTRKGLDEKDMR